MALSLSEISVGKQKKPAKILLYGTDKIGKSTFASKFPDAFFLVTEDRHAHIDCKRFPWTCDTLDHVEEQLHFILHEEHQFKTLVIDTVDWLEKIIHRHLCQLHGEESITSNVKGSPFSFGRGVVLAENLYRKLLSTLDRIHNERGMHIVLIAHAVIRRFEDPVRESYDKYFPAMHERISMATQQWVDCILFADYETYIKKDKGTYGSEDIKAVGAGLRKLYTEERPAFEAGNSWNLPPEMNFDFNEFKKHWLAFYETPTTEKIEEPKKELKVVKKGK